MRKPRISTAIALMICTARLVSGAVGAQEPDAPTSQGERSTLSRLTLTTNLSEPGATERSREQFDVDQRGFLESFGENLRFTVDLSTRAAVSSSGDVSYQNVIGVDTHKVFTGEGGDWATLVMQGYLTRIDNAASHPPFFDGPDDTEFVYRIVNLNFTRFGRGRFNVRIGHFEIPFGLEHIVNTNGTLRDFMHGPNLGVKADWGAGINGSWTLGEYEFTWSRGTGNTPFSKGNPYILAGRVGTPSNANVVLGASVFRGRVWNPGATRAWSAGVRAAPGYLSESDPLLDEAIEAGLINRYRVGVDLQWYRGRSGLLAEVAYGQDSGPAGWGHQGVFNTLVELSRSNGDERLNAYFQGRLFSRDGGSEWGRTLTGALGARYAVDNHWAVSGEYARSVLSSGGSRGGALRSQLRYRF